MRLAAFCNASRRAITKAAPGTPCRHLFAVAAAATMPPPSKSSASAPAADGIDEQAHAAFRARARERIERIQAAGRGFVMNHRDVRERLPVDQREDRIDVRRLHPVVFRDFMLDAVLLRDLRDAVAIHAVFHDEQPPAFRHDARDHAFDGGGARARHQHRGPLRGIEFVGRDEARSLRPEGRRTRVRGGRDQAAEGCCARVR